MPKEPVVDTAIRFGDDLHARLKAAAEERGLSMNFMVVQAVKEFLPRLKPPEEFRLTRGPDDDG